MLNTERDSRHFFQGACRLASKALNPKQLSTDFRSQMPWHWLAPKLALKRNCGSCLGLWSYFGRAEPVFCWEKALEALWGGPASSQHWLASAVGELPRKWILQSSWRLPIPVAQAGISSSLKGGLEPEPPDTPLLNSWPMKPWAVISDYFCFPQSNMGWSVMQQ